MSSQARVGDGRADYYDRMILRAAFVTAWLSIAGCVLPAAAQSPDAAAEALDAAAATTAAARPAAPEVASGFQARPQARFLELVHRLDKETSGLLLIAKKRSALTALQDQFRQRETGKTYAALVAGAWPDNRKVIDVPLHKFLTGEGERRVRTVAPGSDEVLATMLLNVAYMKASYPGYELELK